MVKILQVGLSANLGGIENCIMNYFRNIDNTKFYIDFVDIYGDGLAYQNEIIEKKSVIYSTDNYKKHPYKFKKQLYKIINENDYDVVHINMLSAANLIPALVAENSHCKVIIHSHNSNIPSGKIRYILNAININKLRRINSKKIACSLSAGKWMWGKNFDKENIIPNAVELQRFKKNEDIRKELRKQLDLDEDKIVLGFVGRLCEQKNVLFLPLIMRELIDSDDRFRMIVIGEGSLKHKLVDEIERMNLKEYVQLLGVIEKVDEYYQVMDGFILPSRFEGLPVVGIEAQAAQLPCFFSDKISSEIVITKQANIVKGFEPKLWAKTISTVIEKKNDFSEFPCDYQISYSVKKLEKIYGEI